jgi:hypothetical protein
MTKTKVFKIGIPGLLAGIRVGAAEQQQSGVLELSQAGRQLVDVANFVDAVSEQNVNKSCRKEEDFGAVSKSYIPVACTIKVLRL